MVKREAGESHHPILLTLFFCGFVFFAVLCGLRPMGGYSRDDDEVRAEALSDKVVLFGLSQNIGVALICGALVMVRRRDKKYTGHDATELDDGRALPRLEPIECPECGGEVPLAETDVICPSCAASVAMPEDYARTVALRQRADKALRAAVSALIIARVYSSWPVRWLLRSVALVWLLLTIVGMITSLSTDAVWFPLAIVSMAGGAIVSMSLLHFGRYLRDTRWWIPDLPRRRKAPAETLACRTCGADQRFARGQLVAACPYCGAENLRASLARSLASERALGAESTLVKAERKLRQDRERAVATFFRTAVIYLGLFFFVALVLSGIRYGGSSGN